ncbi:MAG: hypothetical protein ACPL88_01015 [Bryobacteraceae bacterium]
MRALLRQFLAHVAPAVARPLRILWNQVIGFLFAVLALMAAPRLLRALREYDGDARSFFEVVLSAIFMLVMAGFAISSFWRARKISRSG